MARALSEPEPQGDPPEFTIITGVSGAGMTEAAHALEDIGFFVIDNLPPALIPKMVDLSHSPGQEITNIALVVDARGGKNFDQLTEALRDLGKRGVPYRIVFLTAADDVLLRRYEMTKRKHPLADRVMDGIATERALTEPLREAADLVIDTSGMSVHELRDRIVQTFSSGAREERMKTTVVTFGFKHGLPLDSDMVLDVRFLPNPYWIEELRPLPGTDERIRNYVLSQEATADFLTRLEQLLDGLVPGFLSEGKRYLTVAIGCTGGKHRSVVVGERIAEMLRARGLPVHVRHRDLERE
ncbi:MAG TPA: RNase adapter RapZ [Actinomycetota bacterium]